MDTRITYYLILSVYVALWICQLAACQTTHSLIILTDSYINLYRILDTSLGILHLNTQFTAKSLNQDANKDDSSNLRLLNRVCTYQFRRLPVLGSFMNELFLAALLMSAAIEGIQSCFHIGHMQDANKSILLKHPVTYPALLVGFALVSCIMQLCSDKVHKMSELELEIPVVGRKNNSPISELDPNKLLESRVSQSTGALSKEQANDNQENKSLVSSSCNGNRRLSSLKNMETIPLDVGIPSSVSLKSFEMIANTENKERISINMIGSSDSLTAKQCDQVEGEWLRTRRYISPLALVACAFLIYFSDHNGESSTPKDMLTEIADASFAILVIVVLFTTTYPPMKKAGKVLLQAAPLGVDLDLLKSDLISISPLVIDINELHVWSLTSEKDRIGTCHILLSGLATKDRQMMEIIQEAKLRFLKQNINCSTVQLIFMEDVPIETC